MTSVNPFVAELLEKYEDILACSDDWAEKNIATEVLEDLHDLDRSLKRVQ
jgi:hypothetical protein